MIYSTSIYEIEKDGNIFVFYSEKEACEFLEVKQSTVASCFRSKCKCKGYTINKKRKTGHGETKTRLFKIWRSMHERCERKNHVHYDRYGGRGIKVCEEWKDFKCFKRWAIENGYDDSLSIDRIDVNGDYTPDNCKFSTTKEQQNNKTTNKFITYNGETKTLKQWAEYLEINYTTLKERIRNGWDIETAFLKPVRNKTKR